MLSGNRENTKKVINNREGRSKSEQQQLGRENVFQTGDQLVKAWIQQQKCWLSGYEHLFFSVPREPSGSHVCCMQTTTLSVSITSSVLLPISDSASLQSQPFKWLKRFVVFKLSSFSCNSCRKYYAYCQMLSSSATEKNDQRAEGTSALCCSTEQVAHEEQQWTLIHVGT